jgi:hypothetical protein
MGDRCWGSALRTPWPLRHGETSNRSKVRPAQTRRGFCETSPIETRCAHRRDRFREKPIKPHTTKPAPLGPRAITFLAEPNRTEPNRTDRKRGRAVVPRKSRLEYSAAADAECPTALKSADCKAAMAASLKCTPGVPNASRASRGKK